MKRTQRIEEIRKILHEENGVPIQQLAQHFGVSHMTVRRDLESMVDTDEIKVMHGSVILTKNADSDLNTYYSLSAAENRYSEKKRRIGAFGATLVEPDDTLIIDTGSTTEYLARSLTSQNNLTIICYALNIVWETARLQDCRHVFAGGLLHTDTMMCESPEGINLIERHRATKAFVSAAGIHSEYGITLTGMHGYERETKRAALRSGKQKILLADSSKFGLVRSDYFADILEFDMVITDDGLSAEYADWIRDNGIRLQLV